jgi:hypothetical protein
MEAVFDNDCVASTGCEGLTTIEVTDVGTAGIDGGAAAEEECGESGVGGAETGAMETAAAAASVATVAELDVCARLSAVEGDMSGPRPPHKVAAAVALSEAASEEVVGATAIEGSSSATLLRLLLVAVAWTTVSLGDSSCSCGDVYCCCVCCSSTNLVEFAALSSDEDASEPSATADKGIATDS